MITTHDDIQQEYLVNMPEEKYHQFPIYAGQITERNEQKFP